MGGAEEERRRAQEETLDRGTEDGPRAPESSFLPLVMGEARMVSAHCGTKSSRRTRRNSTAAHKTTTATRAPTSSTSITGTANATCTSSHALSRTHASLPSSTRTLAPLASSTTHTPPHIARSAGGRQCRREVRAEAAAARARWLRRRRCRLHTAKLLLLLLLFDRSIARLIAGIASLTARTLRLVCVTVISTIISIESNGQQQHDDDRTSTAVIIIIIVSRAGPRVPLQPPHRPLLSTR